MLQVVVWPLVSVREHGLHEGLVFLSNELQNKLIIFNLESSIRLPPTSNNRFIILQSSFQLHRCSFSELMASIVNEWSCSSCTFRNQQGLQRCEMCCAHRPRSLSPKRSAAVVDLTLASPFDPRALASTESARKRRRRGFSSGSAELVEIETNGASSRQVKKPALDITTRDRGSNDEGVRKKERNSSSANGESGSSSRQVKKPALDISIRDRGRSDERDRKEDRNSSSASLNSSRNAPSSSTAIKSKPSAMVQKTLFGSIVRDIQETDVSKLSNKPVKKPAKRSEEQVELRDYGSTIEHEPLSKSNVSMAPLQVATSKRSQHSSDAQYEQRHAKAMKVMKDVFKILALRNLQPKAVKCALKGKSQIIVMATGGGKSLCYQLPAAVLPGVTIVVSPLIALMVDQVNALCRKGIEAALISSSNGERDNKQVLQRLVGEKPKGQDSKPPEKQKQIKLLYCTPELIQTTRFRAVLSNLYGRGLLALIAIDEAHCLSTWGHDFRPAYRQLSWLRNSFPDVPCMVRC